MMSSRGLRREKMGVSSRVATRPTRLSAVLILMGSLLLCALFCVSGCSSGGGADQRTEILEDYVRQQVEECGWSEDEISYEDNGEGDTVFIIFTPEAMFSRDIVGYEDAMAQDEAQVLAEQLNSVVFIFGYTTDDRLVSTVVAQPPNYDELDEETREDFVSQFADRQAEYVEFAQSHSDEWFSEYEANAEKKLEGIERVEITFDESINSYAVAYLWKSGYCPSSDEQDEVSGWQYTADYMSRATANSVLMMHGTQADGLQLTLTAHYADNILYGVRPSEYMNP